MSLYQDYVEERRKPNGGVVEDEHGFATYYIFEEQKECYIDDIYVVPEARVRGLATRYEQMIVDRVKGKCDKLLGTVDVTANGADASLRVLLSAGYYPTSANNGIVTFMKEILNGDSK